MIDIKSCHIQYVQRLSGILNEYDRILFHSSILFNDLMIEKLDQSRNIPE